jgi:transcriptional regulator with XRE-family HTH domain
MVCRVKGIPEKAEEKLQNLIRRIRADAGVTQAELATRLGMPQSVVSKFESGERRLDILELRQVCRALDLSLAEFIRRLEKEVP